MMTIVHKTWTCGVNVHLTLKLVFDVEQFLVHLKQTLVTLYTYLKKDAQDVTLLRPEDYHCLL